MVEVDETVEGLRKGDDTRGKDSSTDTLPLHSPSPLMSRLASVIMAFLSLKVSFSANRLELTLQRGEVATPSFTSSIKTSCSDASVVSSLPQPPGRAEKREYL